MRNSPALLARIEDMGEQTGEDTEGGAEGGAMCDVRRGGKDGVCLVPREFGSVDHWIASGHFERWGSPDPPVYSGPSRKLRNREI